MSIKIIRRSRLYLSFFFPSSPSILCFFLDVLFFAESRVCFLAANSLARIVLHSFDLNNRKSYISNFNVRIKSANESGK